LFLQSAQRFEEAGVGRFGLSMRVYAAMVLCDLGDHEAACAELKSLALRADASCLPMLAASARHGLAEALLAQGKPALAREKLEDILETLTDAGLLASAHDVRQLLALVLVEMGDNEAAEAAAIEAVALVDAPPSRRCSYLATLARVLIANKRPAEALSNAEEAMVLLGEVGALLSDEPLVRLVYVEALLANGEVERAKAALREAREHVLRRAGRIADIARRERFLRAVGDNAATLALAAQWVGETS
jgi:tetratricopeptide (TPR) repeat protein